ncbi:MAG: hypothetical protein J5529_02035 [Prevotella sp.]|nr:hypothetical protein [Prevotella sp.]
MTPFSSQNTIEGQQTNANHETRNFIMHENIIRMSSQLTDTELAKLIRYIYLYVENGQMPEGETSCAVNIIFNEWRLRYEADKERYETVSQKRRETGRKGINKRWNKNESRTEDMDDHTAETKDNATMTPVAEKPRAESDDKGKLDARMYEFYQSMLPYADLYNRDMLNDFYQYWTELDKRGRRMRFEMQKTWETGKRLNKWSRRESTFSSLNGA